MIKNYFAFQVLLFLSFLAISKSIVAQKESNIWYFGENAGLDFNGGPPVALTDGVLNSHEGCASISNSLGSILFYTDGENVYNKTHSLMPNGTGLIGSGYATQSAAIVPKPGSSSIYYIFTVYEGYWSNGLCYNEVNMTLDGGKGDITAIKNVELVIPVTEKITVARHQNGIDYWVITTSNNSSKFYSFLVTSAGVSLTPVTSTAGLVAPMPDGMGCMKSSPDGKFIAQVQSMGPANFELLKFDNSTGIVTDFIAEYSLPTFESFYGVEFSPDSKKFYVSEISFYHDGLFQYDLTSGIGSTILSSNVSVRSVVTSTSTTGSDAYAVGALQLAPDDKIYIAKWSGTFGGYKYLSCIPNPNALAPLCGYIDSAVYLGGRKCKLGLPNMIPKIPTNNPTITYSNLCANSSTSFSLSNVGLTSVVWNFGDPSSGTSNTSTTFTTSHTYNTAGVYTVNAVVSSATGTNIATSIITINNTPIVNLGDDSFLCPLSNTTLSISSTYTNYVWQNGITNNHNQIVSLPGKYWVTVTNECGTVSDTVIIKSLNKPTSNINDTTLCLPEGSFVFNIINNAQAPQTFLWHNNVTSSSNTIAEAGLYWVTITNQCGSVTDTFIVSGKDCELIIPNVITANNDNINDVFKIRGFELGQGSLNIFDRWGKSVYQTEKYYNDWRPTNLDDGVYFYIINYTLTNKSYKGFVTLFNK